MTKKNAISVYEMTYIALAAVLIAICSWITIPTIVPFTLQTFAVFTVVALLGWKKGLLAIVVYILLGAVGLPVFSGFTGGVGRLFGMTGGYIVGFLAVPFTYALLTVRKRTFYLEAIGLVLGCAILYAFGTAWFLLVYQKNVGAITLTGALSMCVFPFIIPDLVKMICALLIATRLRRLLPELRS